MKNLKGQTLKKALSGDINAFQDLFSEFQIQLRSYLYRLLANRNDAEDLTHDTFIIAFDKLSSFKGEVSLKTWVFQIATNLSYNYLQRQKRWAVDVSEQAKKYDRQELYFIRINLVKGIDPIRSNGADLQDILLKCNRLAMGEVLFN